MRVPLFIRRVSLSSLQDSTSVGRRKHRSCALEVLKSLHYYLCRWYSLHRTPGKKEKKKKKKEEKGRTYSVLSSFKLNMRRRDAWTAWNQTLRIYFVCWTESFRTISKVTKNKRRRKKNEGTWDLLKTPDSKVESNRYMPRFNYKSLFLKPTCVTIINVPASHLARSLCSIYPAYETFHTVSVAETVPVHYFLAFFFLCSVSPSKGRGRPSEEYKGRTTLNVKRNDLHFNVLLFLPRSHKGITTSFVLCISIKYGKDH